MSMQKLVLNPTYSRFFDSNGNSTQNPPGFFEKAFEIISGSCFSHSQKIVHPLSGPFTSVRFNKLPKQPKASLKSNREHLKFKALQSFCKK